MLYKHQKNGLRWLMIKEKTFNGGILSDEMGLGKTIQILYLIKKKIMSNSLIVVPSNLITQWEDQIKRFAPEFNLYIHSSYKKLSIKDIASLLKTKNNIILTSYYFTNIPLFKLIKIDRIIADEAHLFRNPKSKTFININSIKATNKWALTGTPIQNYEKDLKTLFTFINIPINCDIQVLVKKHILRRTKDSLNFTMPQIKKKIHFIKFNSESEKFYNYVSDHSSSFIVKSIRQRQVCTIPQSITKKMDYEQNINYQKLDTIIKYIKKNTKQKSIIFAYFKHEIEYLYKKLNKIVNVNIIDGSKSSIQRNEIINNKCLDILIVQIYAGSTGLNLQHYNNVHFTSPQWNPSIELQAIARVHRIGQKLPVNVHYYININKHKHSYNTKFSIEQAIIKKQKSKLKIIEDILCN